jgi:glyoxylase-like metal-dependent hydrolase (beta-lactamase superfamily II)
MSSEIPQKEIAMAPRLNPFTITALAIWFAWGTPSVFAQELVPTGPAAKSFMLGAFEISVLRDGGLAIANDASIFALNANPSDVATVLSRAGAPTDKIRLDIDALLIRMPSHLVLVDTGYGPAGHGALRESLSSAGVSPDDITDILITHAHPDHVGGLVDAQGRPVFPKAAIRLSAKEWAFMESEADTKAIVAAVRGQVKTFEPGRPVLPGITPLWLPGHTPGHVGYEIVSQGHELVDIGDLAHSSIVSLAKPAWTIVWDSDKQKSVETRRQELQRLATAHQLIFAPHFPFPGVGRIEQAGEGFRFRPELPSNK